MQVIGDTEPELTFKQKVEC